MIKKRIVPEHEEEYIICDVCGEEITDYSKTIIGDKHFHSMYAGGAKGVVEKTCLDLYEEEQIKKYRDRVMQKVKK